MALCLHLATAKIYHYRVKTLPGFSRSLTWRKDFNEEIFLFLGEFLVKQQNRVTLFFFPDT